MGTTQADTIRLAGVIRLQTEWYLLATVCRWGKVAVQAVKRVRWGGHSGSGVGHGSALQHRRASKTEWMRRRNAAFQKRIHRARTVAQHDITHDNWEGTRLKGLQRTGTYQKVR